MSLSSVSVIGNALRLRKTAAWMIDRTPRSDGLGRGSLDSKIDAEIPLSVQKWN